MKKSLPLLIAVVIIAALVVVYFFTLKPVNVFVAIPDSAVAIIETGDTILIAGIQQNSGTGYRGSIVKIDESTGSVLGALYIRDTLHDASSTQGVYITKIYI